MSDPRPALPAAGTGTAAHSGETPGSRDAARFLGTQYRSEESTRPREAAGCLGMQPCSRVAAWFRGWIPVPGDTASLRGCSPVLREAVWLRGMQLCSKGRSRVLGTQSQSRERPPARSKGRPFCPPHPNSSESQVSCSPNCACHRAPRGHPGIRWTAHAFK